jgi:hypothetical protein
VRAPFGLLVSLGVSCSPAVFEVSDAATSDAGDGGNSGSDATTDAQSDAPPCVGPSFCSQIDAGVAFCADFDEGVSVGTGWTTDDVLNGYGLDVGTSFYVSCPHSVAATVPALMPLDGGFSNAGHAWLIKDLTTTLNNEVVLDVAVRTGDGSPSMSFALFEVRGGLGTGAPSTGIVYEPGGSGWQLHVYNHDTAIAMPVNGWAALTFDVTFGVTIQAVLTINGETPVIATSTGTAPAFTGTAQLALGISSASMAPSGNINYDNVVVRLP